MCSLTLATISSVCNSAGIQLFVLCIFNMSPLFMSLDPWWIHHHSYTSTNSFCWQVGFELCSHNTTVAMRSSYFAPDDSGLAWFTTWSTGLCLRLVYISTSFANVEISFIFIFDSFNLQKGSILMLIAKTTFITSKNCFAPQSVRHCWGLTKKYMNKFTKNYTLEHWWHSSSGWILLSPNFTLPNLAALECQYHSQNSKPNVLYHEEPWQHSWRNGLIFSMKLFEDNSRQHYLT